MRVTNLLTHQRQTAEILRGEERLDRAREQVSSGLRVQRPSDAPDQITELLRTRSEISALTQRRDDADAALPTMQAGSAALQDITTALREARTLTLQANNAALNADQRLAIADQIEHIHGQVRQMANTQFNGRYLFAGTRTDTEPFADGPPVTYAGNSASTRVEVAPGLTLPTNVTGEALLNRRGATDLFQNLTDLETAIRNGSAAGTAAGLAELDQDMTNISRWNADLGARVQYIQTARRQTDDQLTAAQGVRSQLQDADLAAAVLDAKTAEVANQASLAMASRINQPSLLDYLR